uniref:Uncharacterized protein n=1 Tax=Candidatus Kentrum sp. DK TaxID=2126562 RepID=A0A450SUC0_9GAMM|nr:MAG: hypothetical protein BECKDK2373B_GA0170837_106719 [Candidatus Kentron sp. DK]
MKPGIIVALILPFIVSLGDVIVPGLIGGSQVYTATAMIVDFVKIDDWGSAAAVGVFLLFVTDNGDQRCQHNAFAGSILR